MKTYFKTCKLLLLLLGQNTTQGFTPLGFVVRVFLYSGVLVTLLLPSLDEIKGHYTRSYGEDEVKNRLKQLNAEQKNHRLNMGNFAYSTEQLPVNLLMSNSYRFKTLSPMMLKDKNNSSQSIQSVITIAQPLPIYSNELRTYIGASFFSEKTNSFKTAICRMDEVYFLPTRVPTLQENQTIKCPPGSTLLR